MNRYNKPFHLLSPEQKKIVLEDEDDEDIDDIIEDEERFDDEEYDINDDYFSFKD